MEPYYEDNEHFMTLFNTKIYEETTSSSLSPSQPQQTEPSNSNHSLSPNNLNILQTGSLSSLSPGNQFEMNLFDPNLGTNHAQNYTFSTNNYSQLTYNSQKSLLADYPIKQEHFDLFQSFQNQQVFGTNFSNVTRKIDLISPILDYESLLSESQLELNTLAYIQVATPFISQGESIKCNIKRDRKKKQVPEEIKVAYPASFPVLAPRPIYISPEMHIPFKLEPVPIVANQLEVNPLYNRVACRLNVEPKRSSESANVYLSRTHQKKSERLIRNRNSAMISRQKKKKYLITLETDNKQLNQTNLILLERISQLESMVQEITQKLPNPDIYLTHLGSICDCSDQIICKKQVSDYINFSEEKKKSQNVRSFNAALPFILLIFFFVLGLFRFQFYSEKYYLSSFSSAPASSHIKTIQAQIAPAAPSGDQVAYRHAFVKNTNRKMVEKALKSKRPHIKEASLPTLRQFSLRSLRSNDQLIQHQAKSKVSSILDVQLPLKPKRAFVYTANLHSWLPSPASTTPTTYPPSVSETSKSLQQQSILTLITDWVGEDRDELYQDKFLMLDLKVCSAMVVDSKNIERFN